SAPRGRRPPFLHTRSRVEVAPRSLRCWSFGVPIPRICYSNPVRGGPAESALGPRICRFRSRGPMRRLMLLRHAKSDRPAGMADHDRPLNGRGRDEAPLVGTYLAPNGLVPDRVLCSTSQRTRETADLVAGSLADAVTSASASAAAPSARPAKTARKKASRSPKRPPVDFDARLYAAEPQTILALLRETPPKVHSLLVVGHNPGIHEAAL